MSLDRHEILKKAQKVKKDERKKTVEVKGFQVSWFAVHLVIGLLLILRMQKNEPTIDLFLLIFVQMATYNYYVFFKMRERYEYLVGAVILTFPILLQLYQLLQIYGVL